MLSLSDGLFAYGISSMVDAQSSVFDIQIYLNVSVGQALQFLSDTLNELGWRIDEFTEHGLTASIISCGCHTVVVSCLPCSGERAEFLVTVSSNKCTDVPDQLLDAINALNATAMNY